MRVACVMLANGRREMVARAVESFHRQTHEDRLLVVYDTGEQPVEVTLGKGAITIFTGALSPERSIGQLRNEANRLCGKVDAIAHWDSDDWSHPQRLEEQVAFLKASGADAVGYRDMVFWDTRAGQFAGAWMYTGANPDYPVGTSLLYWCKTWERRPFPHKHHGEETAWYLRVKTAALSSVLEPRRYRMPFAPTDITFPSPITASTMVVERSHIEIRDSATACEPRMIASIHGGNTAAAITPGAKEWRRAPEMDAHCREVMAL